MTQLTLQRQSFGFVPADDETRKAFAKVHYLRLTKEGHPGHPLYLPALLLPVQWIVRPPATPVTTEEEMTV